MRYDAVVIGTKSKLADQVGQRATKVDAAFLRDVFNLPISAQNQDFVGAN
jgi:hypothetical protein